MSKKSLKLEATIGETKAMIDYHHSNIRTAANGIKSAASALIARPGDFALLDDIETDLEFIRTQKDRAASLQLQLDKLARE